MVMKYYRLHRLKSGVVISKLLESQLKMTILPDLLPQQSERIEKVLRLVMG